MKKFLFFALIVLMVTSGIYYAAFHAGFYLPSKGETEIISEAKDQQIIMNHEVTEVRAVEISAFLPGHQYADFAADKQDYLRWFEQIHEMGANTLLVTSLMDSDFYNAFYEFNLDKDLYLIQGLSLTDAVAKDTKDAWSAGVAESFIKDGKKAVDIIHGRKDVFDFSRGNYGFYRKDISDKVLSYLLMGEFDADMVSYTDHYLNAPSSYEGRFFKTEDASSFETLLSQVFDQITAYENDKYHTRRLIGVTLQDDVDFVKYEEIYARQLNKYAYIDAEHIKEKEASFFLVYRLEENGIDYGSYDFVNPASRLKQAEEHVYDAYTKILYEYHHVPLLAMYSSSSALVPDTIDEYALDETMQGEYLCEVYQTVKNNHFAGVILSQWQDVYSRNSWNSAFAVDVSNAYLWHDLLNKAQNNGLMAFVPQNKLYHNGQSEDWLKGEKLIEGKHDVYVSYDYEGLNLAISNLSENEAVYLAFDVNKKLGAYEMAGVNLSFEQGADFVLKIHGKDKSFLFVNERYNAMRENFAQEIWGINPFYRVPGLHTSGFTVFQNALANPLLLDEITPETRVLKRLSSYSAGKLVHGNNDPKSADYNSLSTFYFDEEYTQICLPWLMLNVGDPSNMRVHEDYYENYGVELTSVSEIYLGIGEEGQEISFLPFKVKGWDSVKYEERLKKSYAVLKKLWGDQS